MQNETVEMLIERIAIEHHVSLDKDDPILILHTMNKMIVDANKENQEELLKDLSQNLEIYLFKLAEKSKKQLELGANAAIKVSKDVSVSIIEESTTKVKDQIIKTIENTIEGSLKEINNQSQINKNIAYINLTASFLLLLSCSIFCLYFYLQ